MQERKGNKVLTIIFIILISIILLLLIRVNFFNKEKVKRINNSVEERVKTNSLYFEIINKKYNTGGIEVSSPSISKDGIEFSFKLPNDDSSIEYTFSISNNEDYDKIIKQILIDNSNVTYEVKKLGDGIIDANSSKTVTVVFKPKNGGSDEVLNVNLTLDIQKYDGKSNNSSSSNHNDNDSNANKSNNNDSSTNKNNNTNSNKTGSNSNSSSTTTKDTKKYYKVTLIDNDRTLSTKNYEEGSKLSLPTVTKTGYTFQHWSLTSSGNAYNTSMPITSNLTLYSVYKINTYSVNIYNGNEKIKTITKNYNQTINRSDLPTLEEREGYTIVYYEKGTTNTFDLTSKITSNISLEVKYEIIKNEVVFNDENRITRKSIEYNNKVSEIASKGKEGYTFSCWSENSNCNNIFDFNTEIKSPITLYAVYTPNTYTITIKDENENIIDTKEVTYDSTYGTLPTAPEKEGYTFDGWYTEDADKITPETTVDITGNTNIVPRYTKNKYIVTYNYQANGGDSVSKQTKEIYYQDEIDLSITSTKEGYEFIGWNTDSSSTTKLNSLTMNTNDVTLYAIYKKTNIITFIANGNILNLNSTIIPGASSIDVSCDIYNNEESCQITTPQITSENTPIIIGYSSSKNTYEKEINSGSLITINKSGYNNKNIYYAQSYKDEITHNVTYSSEVGISSISKESDNCKIEKVYNGEAQDTTCKITLPSITLTSGYNSGKWYDESNIYNSLEEIYISSNKSFVAKAVADVYLITIKDDNSNVIETREVEYGSTYGSLPDAPEKEGYTFDGWYTEDGDKITPETTVDITGNADIVSRYTKNSYTVTYNYQTNGGDSVLNETKQVSYQDEVDLSVTSTKEGYEFVGWNTDNNATTKLNSLTMGSSNITLYAIYKTENKVIFNANNNKLTLNESEVTGTDSIEVSCYAYNNESECDIVSPSISSDITNITIGYSDNENKHEKQIESSQTITINKTGYNNKNIYYAQTYSDEITYNVTYQKEDSVKEIGKESDSCTINKVYNGSIQDTTCEITLPSIEEETGYQNGKWYDEDNSYNANEKVNISKNMNYVAKADIKTYTVTYKDYNENELSTETINHGSLAPRPTNPTRQYYDFKYWSTSKDGESYNFNTPVTNDITLYAVYEVVHYTVTYIKDGTQISSESIEAGTILSTPDVTKTGYDFKYWSEEENGEEYNILEPLNSNLTLYAVYKIHSYTIKFFKEEELLKEINKDYNTNFENEDFPDVEKEGYTYNWYQLNMSDPYDLSKKISSDLSLYITYTKIKNGVIFEDQLNQTTVDVEYGDTVTAVEPSGKTGYTFSCWSETSDCSNAFDFNTPIKSTITLHAVYTANTYTVTFKNEAEQTVSTKDVTYDSTYGELPNVPDKEGYTIDGWYIGNNKIESNTKVTITSNTDITPKYTINSYTVTYNYSENGGVSSTKDTDTVDYNEPIDLEVQASKNDYTFIGWNTNKDATTKLDTLTMGANNVTLYAIYKIENKVTFNANNNKLTLNTAEVSGENDYDVSCVAYNKDTSCDITVPTISSVSTPTVIGYSDSINSHNKLIESGSTITIDNNGYNNINKYYAQTYKDEITYSISYQKEDSIEEIGKENDSCTIEKVYNSVQQDTTCEITLPFITEKTGYNSGKWYDGLVSYEEESKYNLSENKELTAKAIINTYTVTYKDYNEDELSNESVDHGSLATQPSGPTRQYYDFKYWSTSKDGSEYNFNTPVTNNLTLYAVYQVINYTVTFINDGVQVSSESIEAGSVLSTPTVTKTGYDFKYWSEEENGEEYTGILVEDDITLYAVYQKHKYTVTFNDEDNNKIKDIKVEYQDKIDTSKVPDTNKEGYTFDGWFLPDSSVAFDFTTQTITADITLTKKYTKIKNGVTFDDEGRATTSEVEYGDTVSEIASQGKTGYTFSCWSETKDCTNAFDFNTPIKTTKTIYAVYTANTYTVTFKNEAGQTVSTKDVTYDSTYGNLPEVPSKTGYTIDGWYIDNNKIESNTKVTITSNTDITPKYNINSYTLTIKNENGSSDITEELDYNETYTLTNPTKTGYTFSNWTVEGNGSSVNDTTFTMGYQDTTITANYTANTYTITLNSNEATTNGTETLYENYENGYYLENTLTTKVTKITVPTKTGYTFGGYYDGLEEIIDDEGNIIVSNTKYTDNKTITAKWTINSYTLTINRNNGTANEEVTLDYNETKIISDPIKPGYTFTNWTITGTNSTIENGTFTMGSENATLTANYSKNTYQVKYDGNNATSGEMSNSTHTYDEAKNLTKNEYVRNGYTFIGWNTDKDATTKEYSDEEEISNLTNVNNDIITLYAIWSINSYTLTVNPNTGTYEGNTANTIYNDVQYSSTKTIANPGKTGYDFVNWTVTGTGSSITNTTFTMGYENATLTANYTPHIYTITLDQTDTTTNGNTAIYFKYDNGYYLESSTVNKMSTSENDIVVPERYGYIFNGYYTNQNGTGTQVIDNQGYFTGNVTNTQFTSNQTLYASWTRITSSMLKYTDTYNMGCTNVECALDKLYQIYN